MRLTTSNNYYHGYDCDLMNCNRNYCAQHRLLWRDCDTAKKDGDDSGRTWWGLGDCPQCESDFRAKEAKRRANQWEASHVQPA